MSMRLVFLLVGVLVLFCWALSQDSHYARECHAKGGIVVKVSEYSRQCVRADTIEIQ